MRSVPSHDRSAQAGFSLVELLVTISILGVISFALTEAVILGLKITDGTVTRVSGAAAARALVARFPGDVHSADTVTTTATNCATTEPGVFLEMSRSDEGVTKAVAYGFEPAEGVEQDLVRWSCGANGPAARRFIGHFSRKADGPAPVVVRCAAADGASTTCSGTPATITLEIQPDPTSQVERLTVRRRAQ